MLGSIRPTYNYDVYTYRYIYVDTRTCFYTNPLPYRETDAARHLRKHRGRGVRENTTEGCRTTVIDLLQTTEHVD